MSLTFTFVGATPQRAVYKITSSSGGSGTLPNEGGATPDLETDLGTLFNTPLAKYLSEAVADDAEAQTRINYTDAFKASARATLSSNTTFGFFSVEALQSQASGKVELVLRGANWAETPGNMEGVLELELFHTIAK